MLSRFFGSPESTTQKAVLVTATLFCSVLAQSNNNTNNTNTAAPNPGFPFYENGMFYVGVLLVAGALYAIKNCYCDAKVNQAPDADQVSYQSIKTPR